jgi:hypothetical protein
MPLIGLRLGLIVAAGLALCTFTTSASNATYDGTSWTASHGYNVYVVEFDRHVSDLALPAFTLKQDVKRDYPSYAPFAQKERTSRAAVRPTSVAGWRSSRVRALASG